MTLKRLFTLIITLLLCFFLLSGCSQRGGNEINDVSELNDPSRTIGVLEGSVYAENTEALFPKAKKVVYASSQVLYTALIDGTIDAYIEDEPVYRSLKNTMSIRALSNVPSEDHIAFAFPKTDKGRALCEEYNLFLKEVVASGKLEELDGKWFSPEEDDKVLSGYSLTGENGQITVAYYPSSPPLCYEDNGQPTGFEVELIYMFCEACGYSPDFYMPDAWSGLLSSLQTDSVDLAIGSISSTEERREQFCFSDPHYQGGAVVVISDSSGQSRFEASTDLNDPTVKLGILSGTTFDLLCRKSFPQAQQFVFESTTDLAAALETGKIDAFMMDRPSLLYLTAQQPSISILDDAVSNTYESFAFPQTERGAALAGEMSDFIAVIKTDGTLARIEDKWLNQVSSDVTPEDVTLSGEKGTLRFYVDATTEPFVTFRDGEIAGFDVDIARLFCAYAGYGLEIQDVPFSSLLTALTSGAADFAGSNINITEERAESVTFCSSFYTCNMVMAVYRDQGQSSEDTLFAGLRRSFYSSFIQENRWLLVLKGIVSTLLISVLSVLFGSAFGFVLLLSAQASPRLHRLVRTYNRLIKGIPLVVLLMLLFYVIFAESQLAAFSVAIIGLAINFASSVCDAVMDELDSLDKGQTEAARMLGLNRHHIFFGVLLPQALKKFLPAYQSGITALVQNTSIVGYISVQDLTKVSDLIRGRTYEAFFPIILTTLLYLVLASCLISLLKLLGKWVGRFSGGRI